MSSIFSRRQFLTTTATAAGAVALGCNDRSIVASTLAQLTDGVLPQPETCGIDHRGVRRDEVRADRGDAVAVDAHVGDEPVCTGTVDDGAAA